jgi:hypothetical protein
VIRLRLSLILAVLTIVVSGPVFAQSTDETDESPEAKFKKAPEGVTYPGDQYVEEVIEVEKPTSRSVQQPVALLRGLDKISGRVTDIRAKIGSPAQYERLTITVGDCRAPPDDEAPDAFVFMKIVDNRQDGEEVFSGWMFASSPALSAMDHQRYDIWVLSCSAS